MAFLQRNQFFTILLLIFGVALGYTIGYIQKTPTTLIPKSNIGGTSIKEIFFTPKIQQTIKTISENTYGFSEKSKTEIEDNILKSLVAGLGDKHSSYFTKKETNEFEEALRGDFEGIGAVIKEHPKGIKIVKLINTSPAQKAGLLEGDILLSAGDKSLVGETTENAINYIRGPKGSTVHLAFLRGESSEPQGVDVIRDIVTVPTVEGKTLSGNIGYIEVATFGEHTTKEFIKTWNELTSSGVDGMILDFRNNGGGYLETAVDLASIILPNNAEVVTIKENNPLNNETLLTYSGAKSNTTTPIIVLINEYSASASEIFAGVVQDSERGVILGEKSYGKGSVQQPFSLYDGSLLKITVAKWFTPKGTNIDEKGIKPDVTVSLTQKDYEQLFDRQKKAAEILIKDMITTPLSVSGAIQKYKDNTFETITP